MGTELFRLKDSSETEFCLGPVSVLICIIPVHNYSDLFFYSLAKFIEIVCMQDYSILM